MLTQNMVTVACVLRSGGVYTPEWVERLRSQVRRHLQQKHDFVCLSDVSLPSGIDRVPLDCDYPRWWSKLELFRPGIFLGERVIYLDLDLLIVGDIGDLASYPGEFAMLEDFMVPGLMSSSIMAWNPGGTFGFWRFIQNNQPIFDHSFRQHRNFRFGGGRMDPFLNIMATRKDGLQSLYPGMIGSYKVHHLEAGPGDFRIVDFHGKPKVTDLGGWVREAWG